MTAPITRGARNEAPPIDLKEVDLLALPLNALIGKITATPPEITGGCVLLMNAALMSAMMTMALKLSLRKVEDPVVREVLRHRIKRMKQLQAGCMEAASSDLAVFNEYRMALRSRSRYKAMKVAAALRKATDSLTAAHGLLQTVLDEAMAAREDVIESMRCDLEAGMIGLKAISDGLQILIASNERRLEQ